MKMFADCNYDDNSYNTTVNERNIIPLELEAKMSSLIINENDIQITDDLTDDLPIENSLIIPTLDNCSLSECNALGSGGRQLRSRNRGNNNNEYHGVLQKTIAKTKSKSLYISSDNDKEIKKLYLNKTTKKSFRTTLLETVFEETIEDIIDNNEQITNRNINSNSNKIGKRRIKRSLSFCDGKNIPLSIIAKRKKRIKLNFGKYRTFNKISYNEFIAKLESLQKKTDDTNNIEYIKKGVVENAANNLENITFE